jgi:ABC-type Zn2+ transport system substrate-binding protein/surface adhesin
MPDAARPAGFSLEDAVLDIGGDIGALILYTDAEYNGREIEVSLVDADGVELEPAHDHDHHHAHDHGHEHEHGHGQRTHTAIHERRAGDQLTYAGIYVELLAGDYRIWIDDATLPDRVTIIGGEVAEVDWRGPRS